MHVNELNHQNNNNNRSLTCFQLVKSFEVVMRNCKLNAIICHKKLFITKSLVFFFILRETQLDPIQNQNGIKLYSTRCIKYYHIAKDRFFFVLIKPFSIASNHLNYYSFQQEERNIRCISLSIIVRKILAPPPRGKSLVISCSFYDICSFLLLLSLYINRNHDQILSRNSRSDIE